jgi:hypothetical protein
MSALLRQLDKITPGAGTARSHRPRVQPAGGEAANVYKAPCCYRMCGYTHPI